MRRNLTALKGQYNILLLSGAVMDSWNRLAEKLLPVANREGVNYLQGRIREKTGHMLAFAHMQLQDICRSEAQRRPLLARVYFRLARSHVEQAVMCAELWPAPLLALGKLQAKDGDLGEALETLSDYVRKQRHWLSLASPEDSDRLDLCDGLQSGAFIRYQLGQFESARKQFAEALEVFRLIDIKERTDRSALEDSILAGISGCLVLEFRYEDAQKFIDGVLADHMFSQYHSTAIRNLIATRELLPGLAEATRDFQPIPQGEELSAKLTEEVQRCDTPEKAREVRDKIISPVRARQTNQHIQNIAAGVESAMKAQLSALDSVQIRDKRYERPTVAPGAVELPKEMADAMGAIVDGFNQGIQQLQAFNRSFNQLARALVENNINQVRIIAKAEYRIPLRYHASWLWWSTIRFIVRIVAIGYLLGRVLDSFLENRGKSLMEKLTISHKELILTVVLLLAAFVVDNFAEDALDNWNLRRYKRLLLLIVSDRLTKLWNTYNILRRLLVQTKQSLDDVEKKKAPCP